MAAGHSYQVLLSFCLCSSTFCLLFIFPILAADDLAIVYHNCLHNATLDDAAAATDLTTTNTFSSTIFPDNLIWALRNLTNLAAGGTKYAIASANSESLCLSISQNLSAYGSSCDNTTISASSDVNRAYAMFQCRGDQSSHACATCVANATATLSQSLCPISIGARIQLDGCYLRYDNQTFFTPDFALVKADCSAEKTIDPVALSAIDFLVSNVTSEAPRHNRYASMIVRSEYALAQCLGFLNSSECYQCLTYNFTQACNSVLGGQFHLGSCYYRFEPYSFFIASAPPALEAFSPPSPTQVSKWAIIFIAGCVLTGAVLAMAIICLALFLHRQRNNKKRVQEDNGWSQPLSKPKAEVFSLLDLEVATEHFHRNNKLGEGGYRSVYKGKLQNGLQIAVKKLSLGSRQGKREFMNEVNLITTVQHKNLIKLLGSCTEGPERILVYEYLPNGSVDELLFGNASERTTPDWHTRHGIILGMAQGLAYLHEESQVRIIHRDIKPSNILLDDHLNPIIGDFGLARLVLDDESHINTQAAGTLGYVAPEYIVSGELNEKVDVFSFGVVTLEIITGKRNLRDNIVEQMWRLHQNQQEIELVDPKLGTNFSTEAVISAIHVALLCVQEIPNLRPKMSSVLFLLSMNSNILPIPTKPACVRLITRATTDSASFAYSA